MCRRRSLNDRIVGKCSLCGGLVTVPHVFHSVVPPVPTCIKCGAVMDEAINLPVVPMKPPWSPWRQEEDVTRYPIYKKTDTKPWDTIVKWKDNRYTCSV